jgi:hypothetical protein
MIVNKYSSYLRLLLVLCAILCGGLLILGITQDRNAVEKVGTALVMPTGLLWILMMAL